MPSKIISSFLLLIVIVWVTPRKCLDMHIHLTNLFIFFPPLRFLFHPSLGV
jgi:hypothetical protein